MLQKGDWVFVKDLSLKTDTETKLRPRVYRVPMMIVADYMGAVLVKDPFGRVRQYHKNHVMRCKTADIEKWETLPYSIRSKIGLTYTYAQLEDLFFDKSEIPDIFNPTDYRAIPNAPTKKAPLLEEETLEEDDPIVRSRQNREIIDVPGNPEVTKLKTREKIITSANEISNEEEEEEDEFKPKKLDKRTEEEKRDLFRTEDDDSEDEDPSTYFIAGPAGGTRHRVRLQGLPDPVYDPS